MVSNVTEVAALRVEMRGTLTSLEDLAGVAYTIFWKMISLHDPDNMHPSYPPPLDTVTKEKLFQEISRFDDMRANNLGNQVQVSIVEKIKAIAQLVIGEENPPEYLSDWIDEVSNAVDVYESIVVVHAHMMKFTECQKDGPEYKEHLNALRKHWVRQGEKQGPETAAIQRMGKTEDETATKQNEHPPATRIDKIRRCTAVEFKQPLLEPREIWQGKREHANQSLQAENLKEEIYANLKQPERDLQKLELQEKAYYRKKAADRQFIIEKERRLLVQLERDTDKHSKHSNSEAHYLDIQYHKLAQAWLARLEGQQERLDKKYNEAEEQASKQRKRDIRILMQQEQKRDSQKKEEQTKTRRDDKKRLAKYPSTTPNYWSTWSTQHRCEEHQPTDTHATEYHSHGDIIPQSTILQSNGPASTGATDKSIIIMTGPLAGTV